MVRPVQVGPRPRRVGRVGVVLCCPERVVFGGGAVLSLSSVVM